MSIFFFFNDTATTEIYTLSLHDALPICVDADGGGWLVASCELRVAIASWKANRSALCRTTMLDRKSTRLNSSHSQISYAVFCLKKKTKQATPPVEYARVLRHTPTTMCPR